MVSGQTCIADLRYGEHDRVVAAAVVSRSPRRHLEAH